MKLHRLLFLLLVLLLPVQLGRHFWPNWSYVFGLRVDYLAPTLYLTDILVLGILLLWGFEQFKNSSQRLVRLWRKNSKSLFFVFSVSLFLLVNCFLAQNTGAALYKFFKILEFTLLGFYIAKNKIKLSIIHYPLSIAVIYSSLIAIFQFIKQASLGGLFWFLGERTFNAGTPGIAKVIINNRLLLRPYATFPHPNALAGFILVSLILTFPYLFKKNRLFFMFYALCSTSALVLTFSRSVWLVGIILIIFRLASRVSLMAFMTGEAFIQRAELNKIALQLSKQHLFAGVGLNNFIVQLPRFWSNPNPIYLLQPVHNIYLLIAAETGIVGLLIFFWFIYLTFKKLSILHSPLSIALSAILALGLVDHYFLTLQQTQLLLAIILGLCWGGQENSQNLTGAFNKSKIGRQLCKIENLIYYLRDLKDQSQNLLLKLWKEDVLFP